MIGFVWSLHRTNPFDGLLAFWRGIPAIQKIAMLGLCTMVLAGHLVRRDRQLFPFVQWSMYDTLYEPDRMEAFEMYGITQSGERVHINIGRTLPPLRRGAPMKFTQTAQRLEAGAAADALLVDEAVASVASLYEELNRTTFTAVEVVKEIVYRDAPGVYRRSTHVVRTIPLRGLKSRSGERPAFSP